jgi:hypothetical protein
MQSSPLPCRLVRFNTLQWQNLHTKFRENLPPGSNIEMRERDTRQYGYLTKPLAKMSRNKHTAGFRQIAVIPPALSACST